MDFRLRKLRLAIAIIAGGLALALVWHGVQGWVLGRAYPDNTFLSRNDNRYADFIQCLQGLSMPGIHSHYFPSANLLFEAFVWLHFMPGTIVFLNLSVIALYVTLNFALFRLVPAPGARALACVVFLWSYPVLYCLDRGNIEILLAELVGLSLLLYSRKKFGASFAALMPAVCFKLYPAILLLLFVRRRLLHWPVLGAVLFVAINGGLLLAVPGSLSANVAAFSNEFNIYTHDYIIGAWGVSAASNAWNFFRICVWTVFSCIEGQFNWPLPDNLALAALSGYYHLFMIILAVVVLHTLLVERCFARRAILLLLYMTVAAPTGGDYKLLHTGVALVTLILIPQRRAADLFIAGALALCLVPQREITLGFVGPSDTGSIDASLGVITYPLCILISMVLLMRDGYNLAKPINWRSRVRKFAHAVRADQLLAWRRPAA